MPEMPSVEWLAMAVLMHDPEKRQLSLDDMRGQLGEDVAKVLDLLKSQPYDWKTSMAFYGK